MELNRLPIRREGSGRRLESHDVVDVKPDADSFANRVIVMRRHQREHFDATSQAQGIQNLGAAKSLVPDLGEQIATVVVDDVVRSQQHFDAAVLATTLATLAAFKWQARSKNAQLDFDTSVIDHHAGQENALANEVGDKTVCWLVVDPVRSIPLLDGSRSHDADLVRHGKGFVLIVGDEHRSDALALEDIAHFQRKPLAQINVQIGEGFVEQDQLRAWRQRSCQRDPLLLTTREFMRIAVALTTEADRGQQFTHPAPTLAASKTRQTKTDVCRYRQVREKGVVLEDHTDLPLLWRETTASGADGTTLHANFASSNLFEAGNAAQQRRLAATRRSKEAGYATGLDMKTHPIDDGVRSVALDDSCEFKVCHQCLFISW